MNKDIRDKIRIANLKHWQIAKKLGVAASTFCLWLREELPEEKKEKIIGIINKLIKEQNAKR